MFSDPEKNISQFSVGKGTTVADFGTGSGNYAFAAAEAVGEQGKVYAIDVQKDLLLKLKKEAQERYISNIETVWADLDIVGGTKIREGIIDQVIASNVFFQLENKENSAKEIKRILKHGGRVLVIDWEDSFRGMGPEPKAVFNEIKAKEIFEKVGFEYERDIEVGAHHYGLIFRKK